MHFVAHARCRCRPNYSVLVLHGVGFPTIVRTASAIGRPCESTSTCRSFVTISSAVCRFLAASVLHHAISHTPGRTTSQGADSLDRGRALMAPPAQELETPANPGGSKASQGLSKSAKLSGRCNLGRRSPV